MKLMMCTCVREKRITQRAVDKAVDKARELAVERGAHPREWAPTDEELGEILEALGGRPTARQWENAGVLTAREGHCR